MVIAVLVNDNSPAYQGKILNCTDTLGTPLQLFTIADTYDLLSNQVDVFAGIAPSTGADSVSCTGVAINNLTIAEFSNVQYFGNDNALDTTGTAAGSPITSNSLTTLVPNEVLFSVAAPGTGTATLGVSSPFTTTSSNANTNTAPEYDIVTTVTGYTSSFTISGNTGNKWAIALAGFRPGGGVVAPAGGFRHQLIDN
jgi:hypothetical protein